MLMQDMLEGIQEKMGHMYKGIIEVILTVLLETIILIKVICTLQKQADRVLSFGYQSV